MNKLRIVFSNKRYLLTGILSLVIVTILTLKFSNVVLAAFASWGDASLVHGCKGPRGQITIVDSTESCGSGETPVTWLKDVDAGSGLSISRSSSGATLSLASGSVSTSSFQGFQVNPTDAQTTTSASYEDMASGTQSITLSQRSIVQVNAHANAFVEAVPAMDLNDKTSNGNNLTNSNGSLYSSDVPFSESSSAIDLNGTNARLSVADSSSLALGTSDLTIEAWVKFDSLNTSSDVHFVSQTTGTGDDRGYHFTFKGWTSPNKLTFGTSSDGSMGTYETDSVDWTPSINTWYHVAVVWDAGTNVKFYVDGTQQGSSQTVTNSSINNTSTNLLIGAVIGDNPTEFIDGKIDDVRVWNVARTGTQLSDNRSIELTGSESNLVAYYPLEGLGNNLGYLRATYDSGGSDTEIGKEGYTNATANGQSISAGGVVVLDSGTYTIAVQKKVSISGSTATYNQPSVSIVTIPTQ